MRSATKGVVEALSPPVELTLDSAIEYIMADEIIEVTPKSIRMAKRAGWDKKGKKTNL
jgi:GTP-binding protein